MIHEKERKSKYKTYADILSFILANNPKLSISQRDLAKETGYSPSTVNRALLFLKENKLISLEKGLNNGPDTIKYIGNKNIKRNTVSKFNPAIEIMYELLFDIMDNISTLKLIDKDSSENIILRKSLGNDYELIIQKEEEINND